MASQITPNPNVVGDRGPTGPTGATGATGPTGPVQAEFAIFSHELSAGSEGGTATSGGFNTRTLNTTIVNTISGASLASNVITLPAGDYIVEATGCFQGSIQRTKHRFQNTTDGATVATSLNAEGVTSATAANQSGFIQNLVGYFEITASKNFEFQYAVSTTDNTDGLGGAANLHSAVEVYAVVKLQKVG